MTDTQALLSELVRVKAEFQLRAIVAAIGGTSWTLAHRDPVTGETVTVEIDPDDLRVTLD